MTVPAIYCCRLSEVRRFLLRYSLPHYLSSSLPDQNKQHSSVSRHQPAQPQAVFFRLYSPSIKKASQPSRTVTESRTVADSYRSLSNSIIHISQYLLSSMPSGEFHKLHLSRTCSSQPITSGRLQPCPAERLQSSNSGAAQLTINHSRAQAAGQ
jgi:hypothetical protein